MIAMVLSLSFAGVASLSYRTFTKGLLVVVSEFLELGAQAAQSVARPVEVHLNLVSRIVALGEEPRARTAQSQSEVDDSRNITLVVKGKGRGHERDSSIIVSIAAPAGTIGQTFSS